MLKLLCGVVGCLFTFICYAGQPVCQLKAGISAYALEVTKENSTKISVMSYVQEALAELVASVNCDLVYVELPLGRALKMLEKGEIDLMLFLTITPERSQYFHFVGPMDHEHIYVFGPTELQGRVNNLTELLRQPGAIAIIEGAYYGDAWQELFQNNERIKSRVIYAKSVVQLLSLITTDRAVATFLNEQYIDDQIENKALEGRYGKLFKVYSGPVYLAFSKATVTQEKADTLQKNWNMLIKKYQQAKEDVLMKKPIKE